MATWEKSPDYLPSLFTALLTIANTRPHITVWPAQETMQSDHHLIIQHVVSIQRQSFSKGEHKAKSRYPDKIVCSGFTAPPWKFHQHHKYLTDSRCTWNLNSCCLYPLFFWKHVLFSWLLIFTFWLHVCLTSLKWAKSLNMWLIFNSEHSDGPPQSFIGPESLDLCLRFFLNL